MPKNDNAHSLRMVNSLRQNIGEQAAKEFEERYPLSKSADIQKKFEWAKDVCSYLEKNYDTDTIIRVRKECRCNDGKSMADKLVKYLAHAESVKEFADSFNRKETFASLEYITEHRIRLCYPECYCACVKRIPKELSKAWCYCTLGNAQGIFTRVFQKKVNVALVESIKTGGTRCVIEVEW